MPAILDGIRVLDFTQVLSGPTATRYLAEMGAEVIKVEVPPLGDITRVAATVRDGRSGYFVTVNRGKRSICVDVKNVRGLELIRSLIGDVDVVVENFSPGTMDRIGLGWDHLSRLNPRLVMCSISGFGKRGPLANLPGYDGAAQAYAGITSMNGEIGGTPIASGAAIGDVLAGANSVAGILGALFYRERTGNGQRVETSVLEAYLQAHDSSLQSYSVSGGELVQTRNGRFHQMACPYGIFAARDGYVFVAAAADKHWLDLCSAMQRDDLLAPGHPWNERRVREDNRDAINTMLDEWLSSMPSRDHAVVVLQEHRVPCGPVLSIDEVAEHPALHESGVIRTTSDPVLGSVHVPAFPLHYSEAETGFDTEAPMLGEHNEEILVDAAGGFAQFQALVSDGVIQSEPNNTRPSRQRPLNPPR